MGNPKGPIEFIGSYPRDLPIIGKPEIAFAGRSNVGKSSMLNRLVGHKKLARVSSTPGRTQSINLFQVAEQLIFADLPGYGFAKVPEKIREEWQGMIDRYLTLREDLKLVVVLVDARRDPQELDGLLIEALADMELPTLVVATKIDKLTRNERITRLKIIEHGFALPSEALIPFSSVTGEGMDELWARLLDVASAT